MSVAREEKKVQGLSSGAHQCSEVERESGKVESRKKGKEQPVS